MRSPDTGTADPSAFRVRVAGFDGPFDLLLRLIAKHELDVTEIALSAVTDEFLTHVRALPHGGGDGDDSLDRISEFLVVAATLLDLKIAGLLPQGEVVDAEGLAALEARDLLFARLLQYRAFKLASAWFGDALAAEAARHPRSASAPRPIAPRTIEWRATPDAFMRLAAAALAVRPVPAVAVAHLHAPVVSLREQAAIVTAALRSGGSVAFPELTAGQVTTGVVVARFLAVLELYRVGAVSFEQLVPLGVLMLHWVAADWNDTMLDALGEDPDA